MKTSDTEARPDAQRGKMRPPQNVSEALIYTKPESITSKVGTSGQKITCEANYFRLEKTPNWNIFQYRVDFAPDVESMAFRRYLIGTLREMLGGFLFDGTQLFLTRQLESDHFEKTVRGQQNDSEHVITFRLTTIVSMTEQQSIQVLNLILRRAMDGLHLETIGRNKYDPAAAVCFFVQYFCRIHTLLHNSVRIDWNFLESILGNVLAIYFFTNRIL